ncbi:MAG: DNA repair protein RecO [Oscillospiraceae bacterium]
MHIKTTGIVLREVDYKESDKILTVLTAEGGKRTVKARGCRGKSSRTAAACQVLVYSDLTITEYRDFFTLGEADSLEQFWNLRSDLDKLALWAPTSPKSPRRWRRRGWNSRSFYPCSSTPSTRWISCKNPCRW